MPQVIGDWQGIVGNQLIAEQRDYDLDAETKTAAEKIAMLNPGQKHVHDIILNAAVSKQGGLFLSMDLVTQENHSHGTHLLILAGEMVLCVAPSGIAALILIGGKTSQDSNSDP